MRIVFNLLRATLTADKENTWTVAIAAIEENLNSTVHSVTGYAPTVLHLGSNLRLAATSQFLDDALPNDNFVDPDKAVAEARGRIRSSANKQAERFNATRYRSRLFNVGEL